RFGLAPGRIKEFASAPARRRPDHPPVRTFPPRHKHDRGSTMRQHPRLHGVDVRSWLQELFGATSWQTLGFDEPVDDLLTFAELLDEAIEDLYGSVAPRKEAHPASRIERAESPARDRRGPASELRAGRSVASRGTEPGSGGCPGPAE